MTAPNITTISSDLGSQGPKDAIQRPTGGSVRNNEERARIKNLSGERNKETNAITTGTQTQQ
jgi:hypothetical protein